MVTITGPIEFFVWAVQQALSVHPALLVIFFVLFVYIVLRMFSLVAKSAIVGIIAAGFPLFLSMVGYPMDIGLGTLAFFGVIGFVGHLVFASVMSLFRTGRSVFRLGRKLTGTGPKPKVIVKKIVVKERPKK